MINYEKALCEEQRWRQRSGRQRSVDLGIGERNRRTEEGKGGREGKRKRVDSFGIDLAGV